MLRYLFRRIFYAIPILLGINFITFMLFFMLNTPEDMARMHLGMKHIRPGAITQWVRDRGYDKPLFFNEGAPYLSQKLTDTLFVQKSLRLFLFDFGASDKGREISDDISKRMWPSLSIAFPSLILGLIVNIFFAMTLAFFRGKPIDKIGLFLCVILMSISGLFFIIGGQYLFGKVLKWVPISGYNNGLFAAKFVALPIFISIIGGLGAGGRWYRNLFLEELNKDYVKTAKAKGVSLGRILFVHVLKNAMIPILTGVVVFIPSLFMGSLVLESFFGIPGLGSFMIDAIAEQDFAIVRAMVFLGSVLYVLGLVLTDISYTFVDPRVKLS